MKALTIRQPHAWAIARGWKTIENRSQPTNHRGPLAVHAAKLWDEEPEQALRFVVRTARAQGAQLPRSVQHDLPYTDTGLVIATVDLVDVCTAQLRGEACACGPWARPGQTHWQLANARTVDHPFPARGQQYLFDVDIPT
ncbi:ASCH domain-containing protein [Saccharothrix xinjiangensis]|uniref:ASCH domain-containing protein n=1 Tax=Saccharothrix xinjiangensis TaxID=204798 RepID=A0ABV9XZ36_9PSEU